MSRAFRSGFGRPSGPRASPGLRFNFGLGLAWKIVAEY